MDSTLCRDRMPLEFLKTRWGQKDLKGLRKTTAHLTCPFQLDFQQNRGAGIQPLHHRFRGSITITGKFSPLQQPPWATRSSNDGREWKKY